MFLVKHSKLHDSLQTYGDRLNTAQMAGIPDKTKQLQHVVGIP